MDKRSRWVLGAMALMACGTGTSGSSGTPGDMDTSQAPPGAPAPTGPAAVPSEDAPSTPGPTAGSSDDTGAAVDGPSGGPTDMPTPGDAPAPGRPVGMDAVPIAGSGPPTPTDADDVMGPATPMDDGTGPSEMADGQAPDDTMVMFDYQQEEVRLSNDLVIAAGETVRVGPGTTFVAESGVAVRVEGELIVEGGADAPVRFTGGLTPRSWHGIVIEDGGRADLTDVEIGGATYGIHAMPGSGFSVTRADIGTSFKAAVIEADGTFDHTRFHASGDPTFSAVSDVTIDGVNGTLTVIDASPTVRHSSFDGSFALVDMIRVGGHSSPLFDHIHIREAHCGIHAFGGDASAPTITNSVFEGLAFGMMAYTTAPDIQDSVFMMNATDVGYCFDATQANRPTLSNNYYSSGAPALDASCFQVGATDDSPAASAHPTAGPVDL